ncbi:4'-phosphopantetheinyl transferase family protein [Azospirillum argentinense]
MLPDTFSLPTGMHRRDSRGAALLLSLPLAHAGEVVDSLGARELAVFASLRHPVRRMEWAASRVLAKFAYLQGYRGAWVEPWHDVTWAELRALVGSPDYRAIEVLRTENGTGPPALFHGNAVLPCSLSLSHKWPCVSAALGPPDNALGVDIELIAGFSNELCEYYFGEDKLNAQCLQNYSQHSRNKLLTIAWSIKESYVKLHPTGNIDMRDIKLTLEELPDRILLPNRNCPIITKESIGVTLTWKQHTTRRTAHLIATRQMIGVLLVSA